MVKTNTIKTKKLEKFSIFSNFFYKVCGSFWDTSIKKFFSQIKKKFMKL